MNFPFIPFVFFVIAAVKGWKKGRRVSLKYFCGGILILMFIALWHIRALTDAFASTGMGKPELIAQHIGALLYAGIIGSLLANISHVITACTNFRKEFMLADILIILIFTTTSICSFATMKICMNLGGVQ